MRLMRFSRKSPRHKESTVSITDTRKALDDVVLDHGGKRFSGRGAKERIYRIPLGERGFLQVETRIRGPVTTNLAVDRFGSGITVAGVADEWIEANLVPATYRWIQRTRNAWTWLPTAGLYTSATVLTAEADVVLRQWLTRSPA